MTAVSHGCADGRAIEASQAGNGEGDLVVHSQPLGVVQGHADSHLNNKAAESVVTTMGPNFEMTTSFNGTDASLFMTFNNNSRQVFSGASLMGFTTMGANGTATHNGRISPPPGWSVLWGDPAITRNRANINRIYLAQLAVPTEKFNLAPANPAPRRLEGSIAETSTQDLPDALCGSYIGGACIARSTNSGQSFTLAAADCLRRFENGCTGGNFYDGTDMETSPEGRVYAAFRDVRNSRADIWMATSEAGSFGMITMPPEISLNHPRIKWGPGGLYLLLQTGGNTLKIMRYQGGASRTGAWSAATTVTAQYSQSDLVMPVSVQYPSGRRIRSGPQFDFDVGKSETGADQIRVIFKTFENGHHHLRTYKCTTGTPIACERVSSWETLGFDPNADQIMPAIAFGHRTAGGTVWVSTHHDTAVQPGGSLLNLVRNVGVQNGFNYTFSRVTLENAQTPCPDQRGFWGDYDNMEFGAFGFFMRPFTDSSHGACTTAPFTSSPKMAALHMSAIQ